MKWWSDLKEKWKKEWWEKEVSSLSNEYDKKKSELISKINFEMNLEIQKKELERDIIYTNIKAQIEKGKILEEEVSYRLKTLEERKIELIQADNELKQQIKIIESKAHPSSVWVEAFTMGIGKCWDLLIPSMQENTEKLKLKLKEDAIHEAIARLHAPNKK